MRCVAGHIRVVECVDVTIVVLLRVLQDGRTALMLACKDGHKEVVETLLRTRPDVDVNAVDKVRNLYPMRPFRHFFC